MNFIEDTIKHMPCMNGYYSYNLYFVIGELRKIGITWFSHIDTKFGGNFVSDKNELEEFKKFFNEHMLDWFVITDLSDCGNRIFKFDKEIFDELIYSLKNNEKVHVIKQLRTHTGFGLREAKDIVDNLIHDLRDLKIIDYDYVCPVPLKGFYLEFYKHIFNFIKL